MIYNPSCSFSCEMLITIFSYTSQLYGVETNNLPYKDSKKDSFVSFYATFCPKQKDKYIQCIHSRFIRKRSLFASKDACHNKPEHTFLKCLPRLLLPTLVCVKSHVVKQVLLRKTANQMVKCRYADTMVHNSLNTHRCSEQALTAVGDYRASSANPHTSR